jgi:hypothetical protein
LRAYLRHLVLEQEVVNGYKLSESLDPTAAKLISREKLGRDR